MPSAPSSAVPSRQVEPRRLTFAELVFLAPWLLGLAILCASLSAGLSIAPLWLLYLITTELFSAEPQIAVVWRLGEWALALLCCRWLLMALSHVLAHAGAFAIQDTLRRRMARRLGKVPMSFFAGRGSGSLRRTLTDDVNWLEGYFAHMLPDMVTATVVPIIAAALLFVVNWRLALAALAPLPMALLAQWWLMREGRGRMRQWSALQARIANLIGEYVRGIHVVKSFGQDAQSFGQLAAAVKGATTWVAGYAQDSATGWVLFTALLTANLALVVPIGAWLHANGSLDIMTYVLFLLVSPAVLAPLLRLTFALGEQLQRDEALASVNDVLTAPVLAEPDTGSLPTGPLDIEFDAVGYRYGDRVALRSVTLSARTGRVTALVGPSGSGKSTLVKLVARLYEVNVGTLRVGGRDVRQWPVDALLERVAFVFQDVVLFNATVRENLALARPHATVDEIKQAAVDARAHDFIMALPQGYDTPLGDRGARLSGGERQRLSIARALLKNAPILLLDEATSSVDAENAALIQEALDSACKGRTVLVIAHHLQTIVNADHIVVLDGGAVVGQGSYAELLKTCTVFRHLHENQTRARQWSLRSEGEVVQHKQVVA